MHKKIFMAVLAGILVTGIFAQDPAKILKDRGEVYFTFSVDSWEDVQDLTRMISIDNVGEDLRVFAYANEREFGEFLQQGISYEVLTPPGMLHKPRMLDKIDEQDRLDWDFYPTYDAYVDMMYQFEADFPDICDVFSIGSTNQERELLVIRITDNITQQEAEPEFFYTSSMHGDETTGYVLMLRLIDYLLNGYGNDARITNMVDNIDIYINPLANPDGSYAAGNSNIYGATRYNAMNVDINRNFPDPEDGPHPDGNPWQTETIHFMNFAEDHHFSISSNFHGGAEVLNYPWDTWPRLAADNDWWYYVCRAFADTVHLYSPSSYLNGFNNGITNGYQWYSISGGRQDYMNYFHQCREYTHEISDVKLLPASQLPDHWEWNYRSFLNYIEECLYGVRGRITDSATGDPLVAEVFVLDHEEDSSWVYSSAEGNYHRFLYEGTYDIRYSKSGYIAQVHENVSVVNGEATILDVQLVNPFSIVEEENNNVFSLYPNPATSDYIRISAEKRQISGARIYSLTGELIRQAGKEEAAGSFIDISELDAGTYIMEAVIEGKPSRSKFVKL